MGNTFGEEIYTQNTVYGTVPVRAQQSVLSPAPPAEEQPGDGRLIELRRVGLEPPEQPRPVGREHTQTAAGAPRAAGALWQAGGRQQRLGRLARTLQVEPRAAPPLHARLAKVRLRFRYG